MLNKYGLGRNDEFSVYYKSENLENTDLPSLINIIPQRPDAFIGFTANMLINPLSMLFEPQNENNIDKYNK